MSIIDEPHSLDGPLVHRFDFSLQYDPVDSVHVVVPQEHISELFGPAGGKTVSHRPSVVRWFGAVCHVREPNTALRAVKISSLTNV